MKIDRILAVTCSFIPLILSRLLLVLVLELALLPWQSAAETKMWDGSSSGYWGTGANWSDGTVPMDGDELVFPNGPTRLATTNNLSSTRRFKSIAIHGASYALRGNSLTLSNGITAYYSAGSYASVELDIALADAQIFSCVAAGSILDLKGDIALTEHALFVNAVGNVLFGGAITGTGGMYKLGAGALRLYGATANTFTGTTRVNVGTLELNKAGGVNAMTGDLVVGNNEFGGERTLWLAGAQLPSSTDVIINTDALLDLNDHNEALGALTLNGGSVQTGSGLLTLSGNVLVQSNAVTAVISGNLCLVGPNRVFTVEGNGTGPNAELELMATLHDGGSGVLVKWVGLPVPGSGGGFLVPGVLLSGPSTHASLLFFTNINPVVRHPLALGETNAGTVLAGGYMTLSTSVTNETLAFIDGVFENVVYPSGAVRWAGPINMGIRAHFRARDPGDSLEVRGPISGEGLLEIGGYGDDGTLLLSGSQANTHTGTAYVRSGTLLLRKSSGNAIIGAELIIGDPDGTDAAVVREEADSQIGSLPVTVNQTGLLDLDIHDDTLQDLVLNGGYVNVETGVLTLGGSLTVLNNSTRQPRILASGGGGLALNTPVPFNIANSSFSPDLRIDVPIRGSGGFIKSGPGALGLYGGSSFAGTATINDGLVYLYNDTALGTTAGGTVVNSGGVLVLANDRHIGAEPLSLSGNGDGISGALASIGGSNSWFGTITLASDSVISVQTNRYLNLVGVLTGPAGFIKKQPGTMILSGSTANTFAGNSTVNEGTLLLSKIPVDGAVPGHLIIGDGSGGTGADVVGLLRANQIANTADISVARSGVLNLNGHYDRVDAVTGNGAISLPGGHLIAGHDGSSFAFDGVVSGTGYLWKVGTGAWTLTGDNTYTGTTQIEGGTLLVNGSQPASDINVLDLGTLGGTGTIGRVTSTSGVVSPGSSAGTLTSSNVLFDAETELRIELGETGADRLNVHGKVGLANASLVLSAVGLLPTEGEQFPILSNDDTDAVSGTFAGLPEGATLSAGLRQFRISYEGGTGNDVVLIATNTATLRPTLSILATATNTALVSWPQSDTTWLLQANTNLLETEHWGQLPPPYQSNAGKVLVIQPSTGTNQFYRLHHP